MFSLTSRDGVVYGGTSITGGLGTTPPTRKEGAVFAWDVDRIHRIDPESGRAPTLVVEHPLRRLAVQGGHRLLFSDGAELFRVDLRD